MIVEWISVKDRLPEEGQSVLAVFCCGKRYLKVDTCFRGALSSWVSHWCELPELPEDTEWVDREIVFSFPITEELEAAN